MVCDHKKQACEKRLGSHASDMSSPTVKDHRCRACDRCYSMKEKCIFLVGATCCSRCNQVRRPCRTDRPVRAAGRRPRTRRAIQAQSPSFSEASVKTTQSVDGHDDASQEMNDCRVNAILESGVFEPFEEHLIRMLQPEREADLRGFSSILVTVPKFEQDLIMRFRSMLDGKIDGHIDGYLACMGALALKLGFIQDDNSKSDSNIRRGALAVAKLRASPGPQSVKHLDNWITFGLAIVTFAMTALGTGATTVRRHILKHVSSLSVLPLELQYSDSLIPMLVFETWECLLKRSVPLIRLNTSDAVPPVDRLFGLCTSLLPAFYDLCQISHDIATCQEEDRPSFHPAMDRMERELRSWEPAISKNFLTEYTTVEVVHLLCQAEIHRKAALLFLHQLRYPFGINDESSDRQASEIMREIGRAQKVTGSRVFSIAFPFFMAGVNAQDPALRANIKSQIAEHMDPTCPLVSQQCEAFFGALWVIRDVSTGFFWLDLLKHLPDLILPI